MKNLFLVFFVMICIVSCGPSTKIVSSWMEPGSSITAGSGNKALVITMIKDETTRRMIEDELVKRIKSPSVASYTLLSEAMLKEASEETLNNKLAEGKFTHVLMMRLADMEKETYYVPGTTTGYYGGYGRYYGYGAYGYSTPGYYATDKSYTVETTVYSVSPNKLIWAGRTKTVNPDKITQAVNEIADVVSDKMKKEGFLK